MRIRHTKTRACLAALTAFCALGAAACDSPPIDLPRWLGGNSPDPTGVVEGTVLYSGPRPTCDFDADGNPTRIQGRIILTLFDVRLLPPPEGTGTGAASLLTVPGERFFGDPSSVCMPQNPTPEDLAEVVMRSVAFTWPEIPLAIPDQVGTPDAEDPITYRIQGFYDMDGDFNPFFTVRTSPTRGDITGAALVDATAAVPEFFPVVFGDLEFRPDGQRLTGISVSLGAPINTELPAFTMTTDGLDSELPLSTDPATLLAYTNTTLTMLGRTALDPVADPAPEGATDCAGVVDVLATTDVDEHAACCRARFSGKAFAIAACEGGVSIDVDDASAYAWYARTLDVNRDGLADPHPTLSAQSPFPTDPGFVPWISPLVFMQRFAFDYVRDASGDILIVDGAPVPDAGAVAREAAAGIPSIAMVPSVDPRMWVGFGASGQLDGTTRSLVFYPNIPIAIVPLGAMTTNPNDERCQIPILPPAGSTAFYEAATVECQEIPTGMYGMNVLQGDALGVFQENPGLIGAGISQTGIRLNPPGQFVGQVWALPNALGTPGQIDDIVVSQSAVAAFPVFDSNPTNARSRQGGRAECEMAFDPIGMDVRTVNYRDFDEYDEMRAEVTASCCCGIAHLCGLPLCAPIPVPDGSGNVMNGSPRTVDANGVPDCVPFDMPEACCAAVAGDSPSVSCD
ncbi:MAG: hypothetical protein R3B40_06640 [Polyangiales bacterium]|nr:hypothetical protein [Myxococcales bacterium]MCB9657607.1 hypothetical protein [Sandaracinaceae bacterium]